LGYPFPAATAAAAAATFAAATLATKPRGGSSQRQMQHYKGPRATWA